MINVKKGEVFHPFFMRGYKTLHIFVFLNFSMQKIISIPFLLFIILLSSCSKPTDRYTITNKLENFSDSLIFVITDNQAKIDTITCKDGQFQIEGNADSLTYLSIFIPQTGIWLDAWAKNKDKLTIQGDVKYPELIEIEGNAVVNKLAEFKKENQSLLQEKIDLRLQQQESIADSLEGSSNTGSYAARISNTEHLLKEKAKAFIQDNPTSYASIVLLRDYLVNFDNIEKMSEYLSMIHPPASQTHIYQQLESVLEKTKKTTIGASAPDFEIVDIQGDTIRLSNFEEKYLLLTFAASWCDVCRRDNKELVSAYNKFHKKGLQMFTVSFDEKQSEWKVAAKEDKIEWIQAIDTQGWGAEMLNLYNITSIPSNFLIDKQGVIIARNLFGDELDEVLKETLKK